MRLKPLSRHVQSRKTAIRFAACLPRPIVRTFRADDRPVISHSHMKTPEASLPPINSLEDALARCQELGMRVSRQRRYIPPEKSTIS